jgi:hypothetical protein
VTPVSMNAPTTVVLAPTNAQPQAAAPVQGLPPPLIGGTAPQDALEMMLMSLERMSQDSMTETQTRIAHTRQEIREQLTEYLKKLREAIEAAKKKDDDDGFFGSVVGSVCDAVGEVVGTVVDLGVDVVTQPIDLAVAVLKNPTNPQAFLDALQTEMSQLVSNGEVAHAVHGFVQGVGAFYGAIADFAVDMALALEQGVLNPASLRNSLKQGVERLWSSFETHILQNEAFWEVAGAVAKAALIAGAAVAGGPMAVVAIGLLVAAEAEKRYGIVKDVFGEAASKWTVIACEIGGGALAGWASLQAQLPDILSIVQGTASVVQGAGAIYAGYRAITDSDRRADDLERQADIQSTLNRMHRLQRLMEDLIQTLEEKNESHKTTAELGVSLAQTQSAMQAAAILRA